MDELRNGVGLELVSGVHTTTQQYLLPHFLFPSSPYFRVSSINQTVQSTHLPIPISLAAQEKPFAIERNTVENTTNPRTPAIVQSYVELAGDAIGESFPLAIFA